MSDLSTVRGLIPRLQAENMNVLLLNIHESPTDALLEDFAFEFSPTYILYDADGDEVTRSNDFFPLEEVVTLIQ